MTESISTLTCTYDEEINQIRFDWDAEVNPEYNYLLDITAEELVQKMVDWAASNDVAAGTTND